MRSATNFALLFLVACGNYSNEDVIFLEAVPQSESLRLALPANAPIPPTTCPYPAELWVWARATGTGLNASVGNLLSVVNLVRGSPPSARQPGMRVWGPWSDRNHPGFLTEMTMTIVPDGGPAFDVVIQDQREGTQSWTPIIDGQFIGAEAGRGSGHLTIHFVAARDLGVSGPNDPSTDMDIAYDLGSDPRSLQLDLTRAIATDPFPPFLYQFLANRDGGGSFAFAYFDADAGFDYQATTYFQSDGSGGASFYAQSLSGMDGGGFTCWDARACNDYAENPGGRYCGIDLLPCSATPNSCPSQIPR